MSNIFKNTTIQEIIAGMEAKFYNIFKRYNSTGKLCINLNYIKKDDIYYTKKIYGNYNYIIPASIIKLFSIYYFIDILEKNNLLNANISIGNEVNKKYINKNLFRVGLKKGEIYDVMYLIELALITSSADAIYALTRFIYNILFGISLNDSKFITSHADWEWMILRISQKINEYYSNSFKLNISDPTGINGEKIDIKDLEKFTKYLIENNSMILEIVSKSNINFKKRILNSNNTFLRKDKPEFNPHVRGLNSSNIKGINNMLILYKINPIENVVILVSGADTNLDTKKITNLIIKELENKLFNLKF